MSTLALILAAAKAPKPDLIGPVLHGLFESFVAFWPLWLLVGLLALGKLALQLYRMRRLSLSGIAEIDRMDGRTFEVYLTTLFRRLGYSVELTNYRGDYGADLVVKKDGRKTVVQAKRWTKRVGLKAVQEAVAAKALYGCERALVVANQEYTQQARRLARANRVELWDRDVLVAKLLRVRDKKDEAQATVTDPVRGNGGQPVRPHVTTAPETGRRAMRTTTTVAIDSDHCASCGAAVSRKVRDYCLARTARFGGRVYCFKHQRGVRAPLAE